ncbi:MAG: 2-hydroxymuconate tautomerase family protein [Gammaproteobacteria bacterium]|nr:2-hydroxymuconate tautomerase family protein [Gammaproteobacteria bacterium]
MPLIQATIIAGRSTAQKEAFCREVAEVAARTLNVDLPQVRVIIQEVPAEHWTIGGVSKARLDAEKAAGKKS